jgi:uncharacterized protein YceK
MDKIMFFILMILISGCGSAKSADRPKAERVFTDQSGYTCFIIRDENGTAVGGNCVKD